MRFEFKLTFYRQNVFFALWRLNFEIGFIRGIYNRNMILLKRTISAHVKQINSKLVNKQN